MQQQAKTAPLPKTLTASEGSTLTENYRPSERNEIAPSPPARPTRFYGTVKLDPLRLSRDVGQISEAVLQHLMGLQQFSDESATPCCSLFPVPCSLIQPCI